MSPSILNVVVLSELISLIIISYESTFHVICLSLLKFQTRWFSLLKSMVCRCYTYHGCEFMLRFCTELSKCPSTTYVFVESLDGTTSLYNKETGRLMVTFRNENRVSISYENTLSFLFPCCFLFSGR